MNTSLTHTVAGGTNDDGAGVGFGDGGVEGDGVGLSRMYEGFVVGGAVGDPAPTHGQKRLLIKPEHLPDPWPEDVVEDKQL